MNIYFAASIRGGPIDPQKCKQLIEHLQKYGKVFTEHICEEAADLNGDWGPDEDIYERDVRWLRLANVVVAEVTKSSLGVGYEIGKAEEWGIPILCLYFEKAPGRLSAMINGNKNLTVRRYDKIEEAFCYIDEFIKINDEGDFHTP